SGSCRFFWMSFDSAFSGDTYKTCTSSESPCVLPSTTRSLMAERKAASVLPEPVGAAIRALRCFEVTAQARAWASGGAGKRLWNHPATAGWKLERASRDIRSEERRVGKEGVSRWLRS